MRAAFHAGLLLAAVLAQAPEARAFCIYNDSLDADVHAFLVPAQVGFAGKVYREKVEPGKESCCNPKNAECNPDRVADAASVTFEAKVVPRAARGTVPVDLGCGKPSANPRIRPRLEISSPLRGNLHFEPNPRFDRTRAEGPANPRYGLRILSPQKTVLASHACVPVAPG